MGQSGQIFEKFCAKKIEKRSDWLESRKSGFRNRGNKKSSRTKRAKLTKIDIRPPHLLSGVLARLYLKLF